MVFSVVYYLFSEIAMSSQYEALLQSYEQDLKITEERAERPWVTHGQLAFEQNRLPIHVHTASMETVRSLTTELLMRQSVEGKVHSILGLPGKTPALTYNGFTLEQWCTDLQKRAALIMLHEKRQRVQSLKGRLAELMSRKSVPA